MESGFYRKLLTKGSMARFIIDYPIKSQKFLTAMVCVRDSSGNPFTLVFSVKDCNG